MVASGLPVTELSTNTLFFLYVEQKAVRVFGRLDRFGETVLNVSLSLSLSLSSSRRETDATVRPRCSPSRHQPIRRSLKRTGGREPRRQVWGGEELSPERFPSPNVIYPLPRNCRLSPTRMVTRSRSKYSRRGMTYLRERPPDSSLNPAGSRSSCEANHACIRPLSS